MWARPFYYGNVAGSESEDGCETQPPQNTFRTKLIAPFNLVLFFMNLLFLIFTIWMFAQQKSPSWILKEMNTYSPLLEEFQFSFHQDNQEYASIFNDPFTIYKADPSPEVDAAWEALSETPLLALSREQIIKLGKDPEYTVRMPEEFAYGEEMYVGAMDGQHLIHCLDQLRKFAHYDYYYQSKWGDMSKMPALDASHRSHCIGLLLDALKCQPNVNVATFNWMEGNHYPYPDFKTQRKCQNTDQLFQWIKERAGSRSGNEAWNFSRPEGAKEVSMPPQFKALQESLIT